MVYHVAKNGSDRNDGSEKSPFLTIQKAADVAVAGDEIVIHKGIYREWVKPKNSGINDGLRITYRAADGERPVIKGSEAVTGWTQISENVWQVSVPNGIFGGFNPFDEKVRGDWFVEPKKYDVHLGCVYLDGVALYEARSEKELENPPLRTVSELETWGGKVGMVGPNLAKGWVIEENILHDSKCCAISLGKDGTTGDSDYTQYPKKPDYLYQMEAVFRALEKGWDKEQVGSHVVRNNTIYDCGQTGIVGHMGCVFSKIYGNEIYRIATRHEFFGHEIAGIKLHAAIDVQIMHNHIHHCSLGTWLDWQAQGVRVGANVYDHNARDLFIEVSHGPHLVDNNVFASPYSLDLNEEGGAFVHNLVCGIVNHCPYPNRPTPYHLPHSTKVLGVVWTAGFDDRWYQNIFVGGGETGVHYGTEGCNGASRSLVEYLEMQKAYTNDYLRGYRERIQPVYAHRNVYMRGAKAWEHEKDSLCFNGHDPKISVTTEQDDTVLKITLPKKFMSADNCIITTQVLGSPRISEQCFENTDGSPIQIDRDICGNVLSEIPIAGPLQALKCGENNISLGKFGCCK